MATIFLVEDDELLCYTLREVLTSRGHDVEHRGNITDAMRDIPEVQPDILLSDLQLPDGTGFDLVEHLRNTGVELPVMMLSGVNDESTIIRGFDLGVEDYLTKPVQKEELLAKVTRVLALRKGSNAPMEEVDLPGGRERAFGRYRIDKLLGRGSSGIVYKALDLEEGRMVALKALSPLAALEEEKRTRCLREVYSLSALDHPHVVQVLDFGSKEGRFYQAMEFVPGPELQAHVREQGPMSAPDVVSLLRGLARALAALDKANLVHRDIKPANVILREGDIRRPVLVDFGLAKRPFDRTVTAQGAFVGTPAFTSPESVYGKDLDHRSDMFSLGLVGLFALTGHFVFPDLSGLQLVHAIGSRPVQIPAEVDPSLREVIKRMTRISRNKRYQNAQELLEVLDRLEGGVPGRGQPRVAPFSVRAG
ncbi:MAG TPA: hypothetical protein DEA08_00665 [Planctomycetes bacterium]|nr:hypothetical protein [Planctomycetota bacterium]